MTADNLRGPRWEDHEDTLLILLRDARMSATEIAARIPGRSKGAILGRAHRLGLSPGPFQDFWQRHPDAEARFMEMWAEGYSYPLIASRLGCSCYAVGKKVADLGLKRKRATHFIKTVRAGDWTRQEMAILDDAWNRKKLSANEIARLLPGRSRNAVIGQARRMGLKARPSPIKRFPRRSWLRYMPHLFSGRQDTCEYPDGCEEKAVKGSYCAKHHALCYAGKPKKTGKPFTFTHKGNWA